MLFTIDSVFDNKKEKYTILDHMHLKYFNTLLEHSIVTKSDLKGNITYINKNFEKATGFSATDALGENHNILRHPDTPDKVFKELWTIIKSKEVFRGKVLSRKKDGSDFWADTTIIPLIDDKTDEIIEYIAIRTDITEFLEIKKQMETQKQKEEEQKKIAKAKDNFLLLFTHELKTPLNAIINFSKYLYARSGTVPEEKSKQLLERVVNSATKMLDDVTQLLELSRLKSNKLHYNFSTFNLITAINNVITKHASLTDEYNVFIKNCYDIKNYQIRSDIYRFQQIVSNILSNAIKYSNGEIHIHLETINKKCIITIEDNGNGVEDKEKIFEMFEQNDENIHTKEKKGTGIGLSFVKFLCKDLNISYKLENSEKLGGLKFQLFC